MTNASDSDSSSRIEDISRIDVLCDSAFGRGMDLVMGLPRTREFPSVRSVEGSMAVNPSPNPSSESWLAEKPSVPLRETEKPLVGSSILNEGF